jgi:hypothetical protein
MANIQRGGTPAGSSRTSATTRSTQPDRNTGESSRPATAAPATTPSPAAPGRNTAADTFTPSNNRFTGTLDTRNTNPRNRGATGGNGQQPPAAASNAAPPTNAAAAPQAPPAPATPNPAASTTPPSATTNAASNTASNNVTNTPQATGGTQAVGATLTRPAGDVIRLFGGSQSNENNLNFANASDADMLVYAQKGLQPGEADPGGTVFRIPKGTTVSVSATDNSGLRFQVFTGALTAAQQAQLDQGGTVSGITAPAQTNTLYETNYVSNMHLSFDDISPLDGAKTPIKVEGQGGRTVNFSQAIIDGAPQHNADGSIPGIGPSANPKTNDAQNPALRDYYQRTSLQPDGTRAFYFNSSVAGEADKANVSYTGAVGATRVTVTFG